MVMWKKTKHTGVRYHTHPSRKHGATPDKYFAIRYQTAGKRKEEGLGWASDGWTGNKAALTLAELKEAAKTGKGHTRLSARREAKAEEHIKNELLIAAKTRREITYEQYCKEHYDAGKIKQSSLTRENGLNTSWIYPVIRKTRIADISNFHIKKVIHSMEKDGQSERSIQYALGVIGKILNHAIRSNYFHHVNPVSALERKDRPTVSNKRERFFSHEEADKLLSALLKRSKKLHDIALLSIHSGLRAGEIFSLDWQHVDLENGNLSLVNTKNGKSRTVNMSSKVKLMFKSIPAGFGEELVFPSNTGGKMIKISKTFAFVVEDLGLNKGVTDRLKKAVFHTCRHTCASWLAQASVELYQIKEIMGHSTIAITERYAHLCPSGQQAAFAAMEESLNQSKVIEQKVITIIKPEDN